MNKNKKYMCEMLDESRMIWVRFDETMEVEAESPEEAVDFCRSWDYELSANSNINNESYEEIKERTKNTIWRVFDIFEDEYGISYKEAHDNDFIESVAINLSNPLYAKNFKAAEELISLFDELYGRPDYNSSKRYIKMYDDNFYTYTTWNDLVKSEEEQADGFTEEECKEQIGKSIWQLPCGWYVQYI